MSNRNERIAKWANDLTAEQLRAAIVPLVDFAIDAEMVSFWDRASVPYWSNTGEPVVAGQKPYPEE